MPVVLRSLSLAVLLLASAEAGDGEFSKEQGERYVKKLQETGDPHAARMLAKMFMTGNGVKKDCKKAGFLLYFCANKDPKCILEISRMYEKGTCVKKDPKQAAYFKKAYEKRAGRILPSP